MAQQNDELLKRLLSIFRIEADEHLQLLSSGLLKLENEPAVEGYAEIVEKIFREAHSLKGAARAVNLKDIELICQALESVFSAMKQNRLSTSQPLFDLLYRAIKVLNELIAIDDGDCEHSRPMTKMLIHRLEKAIKGHFDDQPISQATPENCDSNDTGISAHSDVPAAPLPQMKPGVVTATPETIRVSAFKFDTVVRQVEGLLSPRLAMVQRGRELQDLAVDFATWKKQLLQIRPVLRTLDRHAGKNGNDWPKSLKGLPKLLEYLDSEFMTMKTIEDRLQHLNRANDQDQRQLETMIDNLLENVKEMYLLPFASMVEIFPRYLRELAHDQGKQVQLAIKGSEIEIDRRILEEMKDPMIHLLRNAIDHGIEPSDVRLNQHKKSQGNIAITITQVDSGKVEITLTDDGAGIDFAKVKEAAYKLGIVSGKEAENDLQAVVFQSGISTSPMITDVSGRGLGLAIVQEKVEKLGGIITLETDFGKGTTFRIILPLAMASYRGLLIEVSDRLFVIPAISVVHVMRVHETDIVTVENRETIVHDEQIVSLVWLSDVLQLTRQSSAEAISKIPVVILGVGASRIAFRLDKILGEQEVAVRPLGPQLARVRNIAGATVLGTGEVVPVLNAADLVKSAVKRDLPVFVERSTEEPAVTVKKAILVVEDSITSRVLLRNILESVGFEVTTAVDGVDAYMALKMGRFDLVVSDVEMPRMDGFTLTEKVRADKNLAKLPIVLVTALDSSEHRERGIDVGANAYIVKSSFDQSNLLDVIGRLI